MQNYPPGGYDTLGAHQGYAEQPFEVATEVIIEGSEREKQAKVHPNHPFLWSQTECLQKRKEQNRLAQRKFRTQNSSEGAPCLPTRPEATTVARLLSDRSFYR